MSDINDRIGQKNTIRVISAVSGSAGGVAILAENVSGGIASVTTLNVSGISSFKDDVYVEGNLIVKDKISFDENNTNLDTNLNVFRNFSVSGISTLNIADIFDLTTEQLSVIGVSTLNIADIFDLTTEQLSVIGVSTLNIANVINLTTQEFNVTGISTLNIANVTDLTTGILNVTGISSLNIANVSDLTAEEFNVTGISSLNIANIIDPTLQQLTVIGVSTFFNKILQVGNEFVGLGTTNPQQKLDIYGSVKISENIYDSVNYPGENAYYLSRDGSGIRWIPASPVDIQGIFVQDEGVFLSKVGAAKSFNILNFSNINSLGVGTDNVIPTPGNIGIVITKTGDIGISTDIITNIDASGILPGYFVTNSFVSVGTTVTYVSIGTSEVGISSLTTNIGNEVGIAITFNDNVSSGLATIFTSDFWGFTSSGDIYRMTKVGIETNNPTTSLDVYGDLRVKEQVTLDSFLNVVGVSTFTDQVNINNLNVTGVGTFDNIKLDENTVTTTIGDLVLDSSSGTVQVAGILSVTDSTSSISTTTGSIVATGGIGVGENLYVSRKVDALEYFGDGVNLSGIVTQITAGIGVRLQETQIPGKGVVNIDAYKPTGKTIFVTQSGDDNNTGLSENYAKKTIKGASQIAVFGDTIKVYPGVYIEENPIVLKKTVSVEGTELRNCVVTPRYPYLDLFHVNNGCHITDMSFIGPDMTDGAAVVALQPLEGVAVDRYFDAARMIRFNLDYIANETVGFLTSGFSGFAGNHREQDAARLIDKNLNYIASETVGFLTSPIGYNFTLSNSDYTNCKEDVVSVFSAVSYDLKANSNKKSVGAALSYFNSSGGLIHITGIATQQATIAAFNYAVGIAKSVIDNVTPPLSYQSGIGSVSQVIDSSVISVAGGCVAVGNTISQLVGIVTSAIGAASTSGLPSIRFGVNLESKDCADDIKDIWKCIIHDITRGGNSRSVDAGLSYYDMNGNLIPQILKNPGEVQQTIASVDHSFNIARSIVNNCTWGSYPVGLGTTVVTASYDYKTGITTINATNHGLIKDDAVKVQNLVFECANGSPGEPIAVSTASYNRITGITTVTTKTSHHLSSGMRVKLENLVFVCNSGGGPSTAFYPSGNYGYDFTVQDVLSPFQYTVNVGVSTLDHTYVQGGASTRLYTPVFGVSTASYSHTTGITTVTTVGLGTTTGAQMYIEPGQKVKLENLVFECDSGGGPSTAYFPSGALGYSFEVISTNDDRYVDASNLIQANRIEIIDKSLASIAIAHSDFYFPIGVQTTRYSRFKDSYRLIQQNRTEIVDTAWNATVATYPLINVTQTKCKRDLGYFVDAISTDIFTGGNSYSITFVNQYFNNGVPISNGLVGETEESNYAFNQARNLMKQAITNQLTVKDLTLTPDPLTGSNTNVNSCANVQSAIDTLTSIVTTVINSGSLNFINSIAKNPGIFVLGENKCRRDIGYIVDALIKDVRYGTSKYIRESTRAYFNANGTPISNGLVGEEAPSVTAFNAVRDYAKKAMRNLLNVRDLTITADPLTGSNQSDNSCANVATNIDNLISILTTSVTNGNLNSFPPLYVSNKIKVNVGVSTIPHTYVTGGRVTANYTTNIFPDGTYNYIFPVHKVLNVNTFEFIGGKTNLPHTYLSGGTIQKYTNFQNKPPQVKDLAIQIDPETGYNNVINSCANVISAIRSSVGVVTTIVGLGSTANIKKTYPGNSGVGIDIYYDVNTATYDETIGKAVISAPGIEVEVGDLVEVRDLVFECTSGITTSSQKFPSGTYGYEFFVEKINPDKTFEISVGISTLAHTYISGGIAINRSLKVSEAYYNNTTGITTITVPGMSIESGDLIKIKNLEFSCSSGAGTTTLYPTGKGGYNFRVLDIIVDKPVGITSAVYGYSTGITTITAPGFNVKRGDLVDLRNLEFSCASGAATTTLYPTGRNGYKFQVNYVNLDQSFVVDVGVSTIPHTYVSGGTVRNRTQTANDTFTIQVGTSTIPHTYVSGGIAIPPYSKGVGPITQGPYVRNCTNFIGKSIGMKVDGFAAEPGDKDDIGVTGTMSVDSYTQYNQGGIGVSITNGAYAQLVSIFTICDDIGVFTESGGQCDITNSNCSFGNYGLYSKGVGDNTSKSIYRYTGIAKTDAEAEQSIIEISGVGNQRPYDGQAIYFGELYYEVRSITVTDGGSGYTQAPIVTIDSPKGSNGIRAEASSTIDSSGKVISIDIISAGNQYRITDNPSITIAPPSGGTTAKAKLNLYPLYYTIESATLPNEGVSTIVLNTNLNNTIGTGTTVYFTRLSLQIATSISLEWVGAGTNINTAKPALGGVTIQENEVVKDNGGQVVYTSTNQSGNFQIGDDIVINQLTGTISGRAFSQSLLNTLTPLIIALGN